MKYLIEHAIYALKYSSWHQAYSHISANSVGISTSVYPLIALYSFCHAGPSVGIIDYGNALAKIFIGQEMRIQGGPSPSLIFLMYPLLSS